MPGSKQNTFYLPDVGEGLQEAEIVAWHVTVGDHVVADQPLVSIETDKAIVDVPSPQAGYVVRLLAEPGERLQVGDALVEFELGEHADSGTVVGDLESAAAATAAVTEAPATAVVSAAKTVKAVAAVRALAQQLGVDLNLVQATGPQGSITSADVRQAVKTKTMSTAAATAQVLRGVRRAMAERMTQAHSEVVLATVTGEADVDSWDFVNTSVMLRLIRAIVAGCQVAPALNTWFDSKTMTRRLHDEIDLGIAVNTEEGLFVPVLRNVGQRNTAELLEGLTRLKEDVAARNIPATELHGQTITLSNFGAIAGRFATMVVVPPQVAILGIGQISERVVPSAGQVVIHKIMPLSLTFDHRAVTGGEAAQFLAAASTDLEQDE